MDWKWWWDFHCNHHTHNIKNTKAQQNQKSLYTIIDCSWAAFQNCYGMQRGYELEVLMRFSLQPPYTPHQKIKNTTKSKVAVQKQSCTQMRNPIQAFQILWKPWIVHMHFYMPVLMFWQDGCFFENAKILTPNFFFGRVTSYTNLMFLEDNELAH